MQNPQIMFGGTILAGSILGSLASDRTCGLAGAEVATAGRDRVATVLYKSPAPSPTLLV
jgi:hypothetical protein